MINQAIENTIDGVIITFFEKEHTIRIKIENDNCIFAIHKDSECLYNGYSEKFSDVLKEIYEIIAVI